MDMYEYVKMVLAVIAILVLLLISWCICNVNNTLKSMAEWKLHEAYSEGIQAQEIELPFEFKAGNGYVIMFKWNAVEGSSNIKIYPDWEKE